MRSWDQAKAVGTHGKGGWDYKWKAGGRRVPRSWQWFLSLPPLEGEDKWELQQVLQQGNPASGSAAALLQPNPSLFQKQKQSTASLLPPAVCCLGQQPISPVVWTSLSGPFSTNIWDWGHHLARGQPQHLLRSPAWRTSTSYFRANDRIPYLDTADQKSPRLTHKPIIQLPSHHSSAVRKMTLESLHQRTLPSLLN